VDDQRIGRERRRNGRDLRRTLIVRRDVDEVPAGQALDDRRRKRCHCARLRRNRWRDIHILDVLTDLKHRYASFFRG
jgi:hypothetical protein